MAYQHIGGQFVHSHEANSYKYMYQYIIYRVFQKSGTPVLILR